MTILSNGNTVDGNKLRYFSVFSLTLSAFRQVRMSIDSTPPVVVPFLSVPLSVLLHHPVPELLSRSSSSPSYFLHYFSLWGVTSHNVPCQFFCLVPIMSIKDLFSSVHL